MDSAIRNEVILIGVFALAIFLFLNFGVIGVVGEYGQRYDVRYFWIAGICGTGVVFLAVAFGISNRGNSIAVRKLVAAVVLYLLIGMTCDLLTEYGRRFAL